MTDSSRRALLGSARSAVFDELSESQWRALFDEAARQGVLILAHHLAMTRNDVGVPARVLMDVRKRVRARALAALLKRARLSVVLGALDSAGIPVIVLKGACLASTVYRDPSHREIGDLDLLVGRSTLAASDATLRGLGYRPVRASGFDDASLVAPHVPEYLQPGWPRGSWRHEEFAADDLAHDVIGQGEQVRVCRRARDRQGLAHGPKNTIVTRRAGLPRAVGPGPEGCG